MVREGMKSHLWNHGKGVLSSRGMGLLYESLWFLCFVQFAAGECSSTSAVGVGTLEVWKHWNLGLKRGGPINLPTYPQRAFQQRPLCWNQLNWRFFYKSRCRFSELFSKHYPNIQHMATGIDLPSMAQDGQRWEGAGRAGRSGAPAERLRKPRMKTAVFLFVKWCWISKTMLKVADLNLIIFIYLHIYIYIYQMSIPCFCCFTAWSMLIPHVEC